MGKFKALTPDYIREGRIRMREAKAKAATFRRQYNRSKLDKVLFSLLWEMGAEVEVDRIIFEMQYGEAEAKRVEPTTEDEVLGQEIIAFSKALDTLVASFEPTLRRYEMRIEERKREWEEGDER